VSDVLVLQKLLAAPVSNAIVEFGFDQVGPFVAAAAESVTLPGPRQRLLAAYGVDAAPEFADVVRFQTTAGWRRSAHPVMHRGRGRHSRTGSCWVTRWRGYGPFPGRATPTVRSTGGSARTVNRSDCHGMGALPGLGGRPKMEPPTAMVGTLTRWQGREFFAASWPTPSC
jgi:hypothetical protein